MSRENFRKEMRDGESGMEVDGSNFKEQQRLSLVGAERTSCNETHDIRDDSVRGDPFCPSGRKVVDAIIRTSEKPSVASDSNLHADTTEPGDNTVSSMSGKYARKMTYSAEWLVGKQKDAKVPDATKKKVFNS